MAERCEAAGGQNSWPAASIKHYLSVATGPLTTNHSRPSSSCQSPSIDVRLPLGVLIRIPFPPGFVSHQTPDFSMCPIRAPVPLYKHLAADFATYIDAYHAVALMPPTPYGYLICLLLPHESKCKQCFRRNKTRSKKTIASYLGFFLGHSLIPAASAPSFFPLNHHGRWRWGIFGSCGPASQPSLRLWHRCRLGFSLCAGHDLDDLGTQAVCDAWPQEG